MVLPSQGAQAKPGVTRELRKSSWRTWTDGLPCEQGVFSFEWPAFNIYEVVRAVCQSRLTDKRRERLPNTLKAMQKRNLSAGKVEWAGFLNEVQSVSIRPSPIFFFFLFIYFFNYFFLYNRGGTALSRSSCVWSPFKRGSVCKSGPVHSWSKRVCPQTLPSKSS